MFLSRNPVLILKIRILRYLTANIHAQLYSAKPVNINIIHLVGKPSVFVWVKEISTTRVMQISINKYLGKFCWSHPGILVEFGKCLGFKILTASFPSQLTFYAPIIRIVKSCAPANLRCWYSNTGILK